jgi:tetratricopeptide (TPR) repeat protein
MLLFRRARAVSMGIDAARLDFLEQARDALSAAGDRETAAEAEMFAALALRFGGRPLDALDRARSAADLLEDAPSSRAKALVVANLARLLAVTTGQAEEATEVGRESLAIAEELGLDELKAHALNTLGIARVKAGDHGGIDVLEASLRLALEHGSPFEIGRIQNNLAYGYFSVGRIDECVAALEARLEMAQRIGVSAGWERSMLALFLWPAGRWQEAEALVYDVLGSDETPLLHEPALRGLEAQFRLARDDVVGAAWRCEQALALGREREWQAELESEATLRELLVLRANIALAEGRRTAARELADEALGITSPEIAGAVELAVLHREVGLPGAALTDLASSVPPNPWWDVVGQVARGELEEAADRLEEIGARSHEALVRLRAAAELSSEGRRGEADAHLQKALAFYRSVGAARYVRVGEALLAATA